MSIGVGTYSSGFGVAFTLLDQFSAVATQIQASMAALTGAANTMATQVNAAVASMSLGVAPAAALATSLTSIANATAGIGTLAGSLSTSNVALVDLDLLAQTAVVAINDLTTAIYNATKATIAFSSALRKLVIDLDAVTVSVDALTVALGNLIISLTNTSAAAITATAAIQGFNNATTTANAASTTANFGLGMLAAGFIGLMAVVKGAKTEAMFERLELTIEGFVGNAKKAHEIMKELQMDVEQNPMMGIKDRAHSMALLMATQGVSAQTAQSLSKNVSNFLTSVGRGAPELARFSRELEKIGDNGKITGRELYQAAAAGIPLRTILAEYLGHDLPETLKEVHIGIDDLSRAFEKAMAPGTKWSKALSKQLESVSAKWDTMVNLKVPQFFAAVGRAVEPVTQSFVSLLSAITSILDAVTQTPIGQAIWVAVGGLSAFAVMLGITGLGAKAFKYILKALRFGMATYTGMTTEAIAATGGFRAALDMMVKSNGFKWFIGISAVLIIASRALSNFKEVLNGEKAHSEHSLTGQLEHLGGVISYLIEAFKTFDSVTRQSNFSTSFIDALHKVHISNADIVNLERLVTFVHDLAVGAIDVFKLLGTVLYRVGGGIMTVITHVINLVNWLISLTPWAYRLGDAFNYFRVIGWGVGAILTMLIARTVIVSIRTFWLGNQYVALGFKAQLASFRVWAASLTMVEGIGLITVALGGIGLLIGLFMLGTNDAADSVDRLGDSFDKSKKPIDAATLALQKYNTHLGDLGKLRDINTEIDFEKKYGGGGGVVNRSPRMRELLGEKDRLEEKLKADERYKESYGSLKDAHNSQQANVYNNTYNPGTMPTAGGKQDINVTTHVVLDGQVIATTVNKINRKELKTGLG